MNPLEPPDSLHLRAAEGWIGLGNYADANEELEQIAAANRAHPDVLQLRWRIYADARKWDACLDIATALTTHGCGRRRTRQPKELRHRPALLRRVRRQGVAVALRLGLAHVLESSPRASR